MKKILIISIVVVLSLVLFPEQKETTVFKEENPEYHLFSLTWNDLEVTTKNFETIFFNKKIISIIPYVSNLYSKRIKIQKYDFDYQSIARNIERFSKNYITKLEDNGYKKDALSYQINGIPIINCIIYDSLDGVEKLKNNIAHLEYKIVDGNF